MKGGIRMETVDCIVEMGLEAIKKQVVILKQKKEIKQKLESYVETQYQVNAMCTREEEIDFKKLIDYIRTEFPNDIEVCLFGERLERKKAQDIIISKAILYAQANTSLSRERTVKMVESAFNIIQNFYKSRIDKDKRLVAAQIEDTIAHVINEQETKKTEEVERLIKETGEAIITAINTNTSILESLNLKHRKEEPLPHILTKSVALFANDKNVIHRECELREIESILKEKKVALLLSGFGGLGKTALARVLYTKSADWFDCVGWVEYHKDLKNSFLASMDIDDEIEDQEKRWDIICSRMKNDSSSKIIFIDNVDYDAKQKQDPQKDIFARNYRLDKFDSNFDLSYNRTSWISDIFYWIYW